MMRLLIAERGRELLAGSVLLMLGSTVRHPRRGRLVGSVWPAAGPTGTCRGLAVRTALVDPVSDQRWERLVARSPQTRIYHQPAWPSLIADCYRYPLAAPVVLAGDGEAIAGPPLALVASRLTGRRLVALPFSDSCVPLLPEDTAADALGVLARALETERARRDLPLEVRAAFPDLARPADRFLAHVVDLRDGIAAVGQRYVSQVRRNAARPSGWA